MYAVTSPYKRKDGTHQRRYVCANVRDSTGVCDQPKIDAVQVDAAVIEHLNRLFIDFEEWLSQLAEGTAKEQAGLEARLAAELDGLVKAERQEATVRRAYIEATEKGGVTERAALAAYEEVVSDKEARQSRVRELQEALAATPDEPPVDAMLDVYNDLARAVRAEAGEGLAELNDRLRAVFQEFRLDTVDEGVIGVLPVLRDDVMERYADALPVMVGPDGVKPGDRLPEASPVVLWATDRELPKPRADRPGAPSHSSRTLRVRLFRWA